VTVIWAVGLVGLLFATYIAASRLRAIEARSLARHAQAEALADAGLNIAILDLVAGFSTGTHGGRRFGHSGAVFVCAPAQGGELAWSISDEGGKVDLNTAPAELVEALARGIAPSGGAAAAKAIVAARENAAARAAAGPDGPQRKVFRTVLDLDRIEGIDRRILALLLPLVTVHSGSAGIDPDVAPPALVAALAPGGAASPREARRAIAPVFTATSEGRTFLVSVDATVAGARVSRETIVEMTPEAGMPYGIHETRQGGFGPSGSRARQAASC
jgi:general secretion pathway protein K